MNNTLKKLSAGAVGLILALLLACEKKQVVPGAPAAGNEPNMSARGGAVVNSTTGPSTTGSTTGPIINFGHILGSSTQDVMNIVLHRYVFSLDGATYANGTPYANTYNSGERYYGVASFNNNSCIIRKFDSSPTVYLDYKTSAGTTYNCVLSLASDGSDFLPDEIEMSDGNTSSVYAFRGNTLYRIDGITTGVASAVSLGAFDAGLAWNNYRKTICYGGASNKLKLIVSPNDAAKGSSVSSLNVYELTITASSFTKAFQIALSQSYTNTDNLSSFCNPAVDDAYHVVISNSSTNSSTTTRFPGTGFTISSGTGYSVGSFGNYVNDCSFLF